MASRSSSRTVYLAAQVRDTLEAWAIDAQGARRIAVTDIPPGSVVLRASERDVRLRAEARRKPQATARAMLGEASSVLAGRTPRILYATPRIDVWVYREQRLRAAPVAALLDEGIRRQALTPPAVLGLHCEGESPLLVLWAWRMDGTLSAPLIVSQPPTGDALDARLAAYAREHAAGEHIALLEVADVLALYDTARIQPYPLASEWRGLPLQPVAALMFVLAGGLCAAATAAHLWTEASNAGLVAAIARERDRSVLIAERHALAAAHVVAYAQLGAAQPELAFAAADALRFPGTVQTLSQSGSQTRVTLSQRFVVDEASAAFFRSRLTGLMDLPIPEGFRREPLAAREGGAQVEVGYVRD